MGNWNITNRTKLEFQRIEAEFYQKKYIDARAISGDKSLKLYGVKVLHPAEVKRIYDENGSLQIVLAQNVRDNVMDWSTKRYMNISKLPLINRNKLEKGDVLVTRSGANYGQTSVITIEPIDNDLFACADVLILKSGDIGGPLLSTYLNTQVGKLLMVRGVYGAGQPHVAPHYISSIQFPEYLLDSKEEIESYVYKSRELSKYSENLYTQATELLEQELGLDQLTFSKQKSYTAKFSEVIERKRGDAEFYNPELKSYYDHFSDVLNLELQPITNFTQVLKFSNPDYAEVGIPIITQKHLTNISPEDYGDFPIASKEWVAKYPDAVIRENDLLYYSVGAYLGKTNIWFNEDRAVHASFITMLRCEDKINAGYLMVLLNSKYGILQSKVYQSGSSQPYIYPKDIRQFKVPVISENLKEKLYGLIKESYQSKIKSQQLLEQAKKRVEELIEEAANK